MVAQGVWEGERQNNVVVYMAFVLVYSKRVGIENSWDWRVVENAIYIVKGQMPTQVQMPMLWKIMGKQT
jgi:hypothetical protein